MTDHLLTAFALIFVIEGLIYAIFPSSIQKMMEMASGMETQKLRIFGLTMAGVGVFLVWLLQRL